jgi:hypothetical protein
MYDKKYIHLGVLIVTRRGRGGGKRSSSIYGRPSMLGSVWIYQTE